MEQKYYYVYIMMNKWNTVSYIGITSNLFERISQHQNKDVKGFTEKYNISKLVYYETFENAYNAISREKQIKKWSRLKKIDLIRSVNPKIEELFY